MNYLYSGLNNFYASMSENTTILLCLAIILFAGFIVSRLTKLLKLPNVSGYIIAGILIGPSVLKLVPTTVISSMSFVSDIALSFIAFSVGKFFKKELVKHSGGQVSVITIIEALLTGALVSVSMKFLFNLSWEFSLLLGVISMATAPTSTMMTINQYKAKGDFVNTLLSVVAFDDVIALLLFSLVTTFMSGAGSVGVSAVQIILPLVYNLASIIIGFLFGFLLSKLVKSRSKDSRLIICVSMLLTLAGLCGMVNISPLLGCMAFGATYINITDDNNLFESMNKFTPPIMATFFVVSGMNLNLNAFATAGLIGIAYLFVRMIGKYFGAFLGCMVVKKNKKTRNFLGLALFPQASVAIGLAFLGQRILPASAGEMLLTIVLASSVVYELIGPACAKMSLFLSGTISNDKNISGGAKNEPNNAESKLNAKENEEIKRAFKTINNIENVGETFIEKTEPNIEILPTENLQITKAEVDEINKEFEDIVENEKKALSENNVLTENLIEKNIDSEK